MLGKRSSFVVCAMYIAMVLPTTGYAETREIAVTGYGIAAARPDFATIDIPVSVMRDKAEDATRAVAARYDSLIVVLRDRGIGEADYSTMRYSVSANWEKDERGREKKFRGYVAVHSLQVRVRDLKMIGQIIDAAVRVGMTEVTEIRFFSSKSDSLSDAALASAVRDAHARAEIMAKALGGTLGPLIIMATQSAAQIVGNDIIERERVQAIAMKSGIVRVAPQEVTSSVTVVGRWEFVADK